MPVIYPAFLWGINSLHRCSPFTDLLILHQHSPLLTLLGHIRLPAVPHTFLSRFSRLLKSLGQAVSPAEFLFLLHSHHASFSVLQMFGHISLLQGEHPPLVCVSPNSIINSDYIQYMKIIYRDYLPELICRKSEEKNMRINLK